MAVSTPPPFARILVPLDGSAAAATALRYGIALARAGASLVLFAAVDIQKIVAETTTMMSACDPTPVVDDLVAQASETLEAARAQAHTAGVNVTIELVRDTPVASILTAARERMCDLIVMGTHGRAGIERAFLGSTTEGVLRASVMPVLTVRPETRDTTHGCFACMLVAIDDSPPAEAAALLAARVQERCGGEVLLCTAIEAPDVDQTTRTHAQALLAQVAAKAKLVSTTPREVVEGEPVDALMRAAMARQADIIIIGSHGRRGLERMFLGSVAENVVRRSAIPVLVVRA